MTGLGAKLPLSRDDVDGIALIKEHRDLVKQQLKNLILIAPGQRIMIPSFGVGLMTFLFEDDTLEVRAEISSRIYSQVSMFLPHVEIVNILFASSGNDNPDMDYNLLMIRLEYNIIPLDFTDTLTLATDGSEPLVDVIDNDLITVV